MRPLQLTTWRVLWIVPLLALPGVGCGGTGETRTSNTITVTAQLRQKIEGWGTSVVSDTPIDPLVAPKELSARDLRRLDLLVFRTARINLVRVFGPGYGTHPGGSDVRPRSGDPRFAFMRRVRRYGVRFMLTGADAPASMKDGKDLAPGSEREYARYLSGLLRFAKERVRIPFTYAAIANEPDNQAALLTFSPQQAALVYNELAKQVTAERLNTKLVLGDNTGWDHSLVYTRRELLAPRVRLSAAALASHAYSGTTNDMRALAKVGRGSGLAVWQTEWTTGCPTGTCPDDPTMRPALAWSQQIASSLSEADASAWFVFRAVADSTHGADAGLVVRQRDDPDQPFYTTKRFEVLRQYSSAGPSGSRRLAVRTGGGRILAVAFRNEAGVAVVVTNTASRQISVKLDFGAVRGQLSARRTSPSENFRALKPLPYESEAVRVSLPAQSVTTFELRDSLR